MAFEDGMKEVDPKLRGELRAAGAGLGRREDAGKPRAGHLLHEAACQGTEWWLALP